MAAHAGSRPNADQDARSRSISSAERSTKTALGEPRLWPDMRGVDEGLLSRWKRFKDGSLGKTDSSLVTGLRLGPATVWLASGQPEHYPAASSDELSPRREISQHSKVLMRIDQVKREML